MIPNNAQAAIVGVGWTKFGHHYDKDLEELAREAGLHALIDAGIERKDLDAIYMGSFVPEIATHQGSIACVVSEAFGLDEYKIPIYRPEAACASGGVAIDLAIQGIRSGKFDVVLLGGVEKLTDSDATLALSSAASSRERDYHFNFIDLNANVASRHMYEYGTKREHLAMMSVMNHKHARDNEKAQFRNQVKVEDILELEYISEPLTLYDCSPVSDGAAAAILVNPELAKDFEDPVFITGCGHATDSINLSARKDITTFEASIVASRTALKEANKTLRDVNICEIHDAFSILGILSIEDLGFCEKGEGGKIIEESFDPDAKHVVIKTRYGEKIFNCGGGLKAHGHAVGATGVRQLVEIYLQLRYDKKHPVYGKFDHPVNSSLGEDPAVGMVQNIGGVGGDVTCQILEV